MKLVEIKKLCYMTENELNNFKNKLEDINLCNGIECGEIDCDECPFDYKKHTAIVNALMKEYIRINNIIVKKDE